MDKRPRILLADDEPDVLETFRGILAQIPSRPEVITAANGELVIKRLEVEPFDLLLCDLKMPKMDGLQVLAIVRRKYPQLRTVAMTAELDEQYRSRAYALGVDLFWHKPASEQETRMFMECIESLLGRETEGGFRGMQSKSLVDIIQLECISQSSLVLRITNSALSGKIWIQTGELVDAEAGDLRGEAAFQRILSWRAGSFESLPEEPARPRTIFKSYNAMLLESAQALDESHAGVTPEGAPQAAASPLAKLSKLEGVEFVLTMNVGGDGYQDARGLENPERMAAWARDTMERFRLLGDDLGAGEPGQIEAFGPQRHVALARQADKEFCVGWKYSLTSEEVRDMMKKLLALWAS